MSTFLFDSIIFGPVWSRRLGESLGINLMPVARKVCNFNCIYCECGLTPDTDQQNKLPQVSEVLELLDMKLSDMHLKGAYLDSITFAGNGEPTLHPEFPEIISATIKSRNRLFPGANIAVLSNATLIGNKKVFNALLKADLNILKLDSAVPETLAAINCPKGIYDLSEIVNAMEQFKGKLIIQTLFLKGTYNNHPVDNTTQEEVDVWLSVLNRIRPESVMIYSLARDTAVGGLEKISAVTLEAIALQVEKLGIKTQVTP
jgi:wyosine [tRNA(Phe)-imidazoG37] synthetase (radical SAM superfamily)